MQSVFALTEVATILYNIALSKISSISLFLGKLGHWQYCCNHGLIMFPLEEFVHCSYIVCISESFRLSLWKKL